MQALAKQMNTDPQKLQAAMQTGDVNAVTALLPEQQAMALKQILSDPKATQQLLNSKEAAELKNQFKR